MERLTCKELRELLNAEGSRFIGYSKAEVKSYIKKNYICSRYAVEKLAEEFATC